MLHRTTLLIVFWLFFPAAHLVLAQSAPLNQYEWQNLTFRYPDHWKIVLDEENNRIRQIKLLPNDHDGVSIMLSLFQKFPEPDEAYREMPVKASVSFGLGLALKLAGEAGGDAVALHYGSIELSEGPGMSARFTVLPPDADTFYMLECFHARDEETEMAFMGMIVTKGTRGQLIEDLKYISYIEEAYAIVRSIAIN